MPEEELERVGRMPIWELSEYFGMPEELARQRVEVLYLRLGIHRGAGRKRPLYPLPIR